MNRRLYGLADLPEDLSAFMEVKGWWFDWEKKKISYGHNKFNTAQQPVLPKTRRFRNEK